MKTKLHFALGLVLFAVLFDGCRKNDAADYNPVINPDMAALKKQYFKAVIDASVVEPFEIYRSLIAVINYGDSSAGPGNLTWSLDSAGRYRVLVSSWMKQGNLKYWPMGKPFKLSNNQAYMPWVTSVPELSDFLKWQKFTDTTSLRIRVAQVLGMPAYTENNYIVEFWVYPENMFRPTPDPEITDHEANLYFPSSATVAYRTWFNNLIQIQYDTTKNPFPWTRLGYTYDWGNPVSEIGLSEFVIDTSSLVTVENIYTTWQYYQLSQVKK